MVSTLLPFRQRSEWKKTRLAQVARPLDGVRTAFIAAKDAADGLSRAEIRLVLLLDSAWTAQDCALTVSHASRLGPDFRLHPRAALSSISRHWKMESLCLDVFGFILTLKNDREFRKNHIPFFTSVSAMAGLQKIDLSSGTHRQEFRHLTMKLLCSCRIRRRPWVRGHWLSSYAS